jgi:predicted CXXCH cytochrome family protein
MRAIARPLAQTSLAVLFAVTFAPRAVAQAQDRRPDHCIGCHRSLTDSRDAAPVAAFEADIHRERGFTCVDCHGGDASAADKARAKAPTTGYRGAPRGAAQISACARCHSDADLMRRFAPRQRIDQAAEYVTSVHGARLAKGDTKVATCASCHGAHGIRPVLDAKSPVFPTNVAATCAVCHAHASHMAGYTRPDGSALPTTQRAEYEKSVHFTALTKLNDLSAPTCNDCHGNHGAAPPGVDAVVNVCGTCHAIFATKFNASKHRPIFDKGCVECHGNHAIDRPSDEMLGTSAQAVCSSCHSDPDDPGFVAAGTMRKGIDRLEAEITRVTALVERVRTSGIEMSDEELALGEARNRVVLARTEVHAFSAASLEPIVGDGLRILGNIESAAQNGLSELRFRRRGLAVSLAAILIVVVALAMKIRQLDRRATE